MKKSVYKSKILLMFSVFICLLFFVVATKSLSQPLEINWIPGPQTVVLGENVAQIDLAMNYAFATAEDTRKLMEYYGNPAGKETVGMVVPKSESSDWAIIFEYIPIGYISDDEKDSIDSTALLENLKKGQEEANKERAKKGTYPLKIMGWHEKPHYDAISNNLVWALLLEAQGQKVVNYDVRLLGRYGFMSVTLVSDLASFETNKPEIENIMSHFSYKKGKNYAEYVQGDKLAKYGLTALVAGGVGAIAAKTGLLKSLGKFIKYIVVGVIAFFAAIRKKIKRLFGRGEVTNTID